MYLYPPSKFKIYNMTGLLIKTNVLWFILKYNLQKDIENEYEWQFRSFQPESKSPIITHKILLSQHKHIDSKLEVCVCLWGEAANQLSIHFPSLRCLYYLYFCKKKLGIGLLPPRFRHLCTKCPFRILVR